MKKTNKIIYLGVLFTFMFLVGLLLNNLTIVNSNENINENLQIELPTEPEEITLETPQPKPAWAGSMNNITIDELGFTVGSYTWAQAELEPWCTKKNGRYYIENVTIDASTSPTGHGILINNSVNTYFTIRNCTITGAISAGIVLQMTCNGTIIGNNCSYNYYGVYMQGLGNIFRAKNNTIVNNTLNWNNRAFQGWAFNDNIIDNNNMNYNDNYGINIAGRTNNNNFTNNIIRDVSSVTPSLIDGFYLYNSDGNNFINNTVINCQSIGMYFRYGSAGNTIKNNTIINSFGRGILLHENSDNNIVENNTIKDCGTYGIEILESGSDVQVKNNTIINAGDAGIRLIWNPSLITITDNKMINCSILIDPTTYGHSLTNLRTITIAANNTVNGKTVYCYVDEEGLGDSNFTKYGDIGQIILINCSISNISDFSIPNPIPITLLYCNNNIIYNNILGLDGYGHSAIIIGYSSFNNITDNIVSGAKSYGILIIRNSGNNTFWDNDIINNQVRGVMIVNTSDNDCQGNTFYSNTFNNPLGTNAEDDCLGNRWYLETTGNSWHDYVGRDANDNNRGDTPYNISGDADAKDMYPIYSDQRDIFPPAAGDDDDDDDDDDDTGAVVVIVVVVIIVCVGAGVVVIIVLIKKGIIDLSKPKRT